MKKRTSMLTAMVIILIAVFACVGFKMAADKDNGKDTATSTSENTNQNVMSSEAAKIAINKSVGNVNFVDDYSIIKKNPDNLDYIDIDVVTCLLVQDDTSNFWNVWRVTEDVPENICIGFLFDDDQNVVWATPCNRDFINQDTLRMQLDFTSADFHSNENSYDGSFAWTYNNCASCVSEKEASSVWAYDKSSNACSLVWSNNLPYDDLH